MSWLVPKLEVCGEIELEEEVREKLLTISASTIDHLLKGEKKKITLKSRKSTKPGTLLKNQIEVRTFADWNKVKVGFMEMDLVSHEGGNLRGDFAFSLTLTDVCSGWTENRAVKNRAQKWTFEALDIIKKDCPSPLKVWTQIMIVPLSTIICCITVRKTILPLPDPEQGTKMMVVT